LPICSSTLSSISAIRRSLPYSTAGTSMAPCGSSRHSDADIRCSRKRSITVLVHSNIDDALGDPGAVAAAFDLECRQCRSLGFDRRHMTQRIDRLAPSLAV